MEEMWRERERRSGMHYSRCRVARGREEKKRGTTVMGVRKENIAPFSLLSPPSPLSTL
jgi:hypothetical protein